MGLLQEDNKTRLRGLFAGLTNDVRLLLFTQEFECQYCQVTRELLEELAALSARISLEKHDFAADAELAKSLGVDKIPAVIVMAERDVGIRFYGVPSGYEFAALVDDILDLGGRGHGLSPDVIEVLAGLEKPVRIEVVASPTCPYCPRAVRTAHRLAQASELIGGEMVEAAEFPFVVQKYGVSGVPHTVFNGALHLIGALSEIEFARKALEAQGKG